MKNIMGLINVGGSPSSGSVDQLEGGPEESSSTPRGTATLHGHASSSTLKQRRLRARKPSFNTNGKPYYEVNLPEGADDGLHLHDLVVLPKFLYWIAKTFFGATRRSLPITAIVGCVGGILAVLIVTQVIQYILGVLRDAFSVDYPSMNQGVARSYITSNI